MNTLMVKDAAGGYSVASQEQVLKAAEGILYAAVESGEKIMSTDDSGRYFAIRIKNLEHEVFSVVFLQLNNQIIAVEDMFRGTIARSTVHPREVVKRAMQLNAAAVIFGHNHPSGNTQPSQEDVQITKRLIEALDLVEVRVLDHIIIGNGKPYSLAEHGLI